MIELTALNDADLPIELKYDAARDLQMRIVHTVLKEGFKYHLGKADVINTVQLKTTSLIKESSTKAHPGLVQAVGGTAIMMLLFSIAAIGGGLLDEKEAGTLKRLLIAPVKPLHILLVDDNPDNRLLVKAYLKKLPYKLEEAKNGEEALSMFTQSDYDVVLMDVQMPVMDGREASDQPMVICGLSRVRLFSSTTSSSNTLYTRVPWWWVGVSTCLNLPHIVPSDLPKH